MRESCLHLGVPSCCSIKMIASSSERNRSTIPNKLNFTDTGKEKRYAGNVYIFCSQSHGLWHTSHLLSKSITTSITYDI